jgi:hypothetical protein
MSTRPTRAPRKRPSRTRPRTARPDINHDRPIPEIARRFAENIVRRMWPTLYVQIASAPEGHTPEAHVEERSSAAA